MDWSVERIIGKGVSKRKKVVTPNHNGLEISLPLYGLIGLYAESEQYQRFLSNLFQALTIDDPFQGFSSDEQASNMYQALVEIKSFRSRYSLQEGLTFTEASERVVSEIEASFAVLKERYNDLSLMVAKEFVNKSLAFIRGYEDNRGRDLSGLIEAAKALPISESSRFLNCGNWFLVADKIATDIKARAGSIQALLESEGLSGNPLSKLEQLLSEGSTAHQQELLRRIKLPEIISLIGDRAFHTGEVSDEYLKEVAQSTLVRRSLILLAPSASTTHIEKDLNDLVEYQFANDNQYLIEEESNSEDAGATGIKYDFLVEGTVIQDNGRGMNRTVFFEKYPMAYISFKEGNLNIGRFGVGSKAKLVEVIGKSERGEIRNGTVYVEACDGHEAFMQRYFLHEGSLHIGFSRSSLAEKGVKITIVPTSVDPARREEQRKHILTQLKHVNPRRFEVVVDGVRVNQNSVLQREKDLKSIVYESREHKVFFDPLREGTLTALSGEKLIYEIPAPFSCVMEIPLQMDPIEGRTDLVYTDALRTYLCEVFRTALLPELVKRKDKEGTKKCLEWFLRNKTNQNPFYHFEQLAASGELMGFYTLLYPQKKFNEQSYLVEVENGASAKLNEIIPFDLFLANREHHPKYLLSLEQYVKIKREEGEKEMDGVKKHCQSIMEEIFAHPRSEFKPQQEGGDLPPLKLGSDPIYLIYLRGMNYKRPFYFDLPNRLLLINIEHKSFQASEKARLFYLTETLRIAAEGSLE
jgi:hypothetical protein